MEKKYYLQISEKSGVKSVIFLNLLLLDMKTISCLKNYTILKIKNLCFMAAKNLL